MQHRTRMTKSKLQGFTLIEILIVIVIISIVSGVALMTISSNQKKQMETFAYQLTRLLTLAEQEAMLRPATLGLSFDEQYFQFFDYKITKERTYTWEAITSKSLGFHKIPDFMHISLKVNNQSTPLDGKPHILISESGDITAFTLAIAKKGDKPLYLVKGEASGKIRVELFHEK